MSLPFHARGANGCLCCTNTVLTKEYSVISGYFAFKAWQGKPEPVALNHCPKCGVAFFERGLTDDEASAYYSGYGDEKYFLERNKFEPFYTRQHHDMISLHLSSQARRHEVKNHIVAAGLAPNADCVLDYGGGDGSPISGVDSKRKVVFDPSGSHGLAGIEVFKGRKKLPKSNNLIVCAQVLEHVSDPFQLIED